MIQQTDTQGTTGAPRGDSDPRTLLANYVAICNQAIVENRNRFWLKQAKRLNEKLWNGANFRTDIYDRNPGDVIDEGVLHFDANAMELIHTLPDWYMKNPLRLDWGWMKERVADEARYRIDGPSLAAGVVLGGAVTGLVLTRHRKKLHA